MTRDLKRTFSERPKALNEALAWLVGCHYLRRRPDPPRPAGRPGPKPSETFDVNPYLIVPQNPGNHPNSIPGDDPGDLGDFAAHQGRLDDEEVGDDDIPF